MAYDYEPEYNQEFINSTIGQVASIGSIVVTSISSVILLFSIGLWVANRSHPLLRHRSFPLACLLVATSLTLILWQCLYVVLLGEFENSTVSFLFSCRASIASLAVIPSVRDAIQIFRLMRWYTNTKHNENLVAVLDEIERNTPLGDNQSRYIAEQAKLQKIEEINLNYCPYLRGLIIYLCTFFAFLLIVLNRVCERQENCCYGHDFKGSIIAWNIAGVSGLGYVWHQANEARKSHPDPCCLVDEIYWYSVISLVGTALFISFNTTDIMSMHEESEERNHPYIFLFIAPISLQTMLSVTFPVYKSYRTPPHKYLNDVSFGQIVSSPTGSRFLEQYMIYDLSVESYHFYKAVIQWKSRYDDNSAIVNLKEARRIAKKFIDTAADYAINVSGAQRQDLITSLQVEFFPMDGFNAVLWEVEKMLKFEVLPRFKRTKLFTCFIGTPSSWRNHDDLFRSSSAL